MSFRHAVKTGVAAALTLLVFRLLRLADWSHEAWGVISAVLVMQSNLGGSLKAAVSRIEGTAVGALVGAATAATFGVNALSVGAAVALTTRLCGLLNLQESLRLASATVGIIMLTVPSGPWEAALERFLDIALGIAVGLLTQVALWPSRADRELRPALAGTLETCGAFFARVARAGLGGAYPDDELTRLRTEARQAAQRNRDLMHDARNEPLGRSPEGEMLFALEAQVEEVHRQILALGFAAREMAGDTFRRNLEPHLAGLADAAVAAFGWLARAVAEPEAAGPPPDLESPLAALDTEFAALRARHASREHPTEEILRFCSFYFNLRSIARQLMAMTVTVAGRPESDRPA